MTTKRSVEAEAAAMMRRLLEAVERGELEPGGAQGVALVRRLEGAAMALEVAAGKAEGGGSQRGPRSAPVQRA